ncbi:MAG TPA: TonB-dependent siderophore receptor [Acidobacteriota bacterium]|nr:TonB-dependent siderophore receptor [Acidobacteriota bacterium]
MKNKFLVVSIRCLALLLTVAWAQAEQEPSTQKQGAKPPSAQEAAVKSSDDTEEESANKADNGQVQGPDTTVTVRGRVEAVPSQSTTAAKMAVDLHKTPLSVSVVDEGVLEAQNAVVLGDALRNAAGVNAQTGFGIFDFFTVRGFDNLSTGLVLIDGTPEPESTYYQLYNVERVEVLRGPAAFLYGANALSGTVNLVRKQPLFNRNFAEVELTGGSFHTFRGRFDVNVVDPSGEIAFRFNGTHQDAENYRDEKDSYLTAFNPAFTWKISDASTLSMNFEYVRNKFEPDAGIPLLFGEIPNIDRETSFQSPFDTSEQDIHRFRAEWSHRISDRVTFRNKFYISDLDWTSDGTLFAGAFPNQQGGTDVFRVFSALDDKQRFTGNQAEFLVQAQTGSLRHEFVFGLETAKLDDQFSLDNFFLPPIDLFNPTEFAQREFLIPIQGQSQRGDARSLVFAPYVLDRIVFSDAVQIFVGGRFDHIDFEDPVNNLERGDNEFSPMGGIVVEPVAGLSLYASAGRSFAPPSTLTTQPREPETGRNYEGGIKNSFLNGRFLASLAIYQTERENIAIFDDNGVTTQNGDQRSRGVELELSAEILPNWFTYASYAFNDAELTSFNERVQISQVPPQFIVVDRSGNQPAFAPDHLFNLWTHKEFLNGFGLGAGVRYVSEQFIAEDNAFAIDDYVLVNAMASYRINRWRLAVNFDNIGDTDYETRGFSSQSVIPGNPFAVYASLRYAFEF